MKLGDESLDEALRALSHTDRRKFLRACRAGERSAGDLASLSDLAPATVSEHLKVLRKSGLLRLNRQGRHWMYETDAQMIESIVRALHDWEKTDGS